jgi:hypothetical protein
LAVVVLVVVLEPLSVVLVAGPVVIEQERHYLLRKELNTL